VADRPKVAVTGAGGFIGGRVVEALHLSGQAVVTALVRRWGSAVRVARQPIDIRLCDLTNAQEVSRCLRDATHVVHCATGGGGVDVAGTRHVLEAAGRYGIERVVYLSTVAVFGEVEGTVTEESAGCAPLSAYAAAKLEAETVCHTFSQRGVPVVIFRPTIVYGPFSESWVVEFVGRMRQGRWMLPPEDCQGVCNLLYVDDLVAAISRALHDPRAVGETFIVNGPDKVTWQDYFVALNQAAGFPALRTQNRLTSHLAAAAMMPVRKAAKLLLQHFRDPILTLYKRHAVMRRVMRRAEAAIRQTPTTSEFDLYRRRVHFSAEKVERVLGHRPRVSMMQGLELVGPWLKHHRYC
jgi:nucleoside-diphosphate-sugar epimerase